MSKTIDNLVSVGKKVLLILGLAGLTSCINLKKDYHFYSEPHQKQAIGLYNVRQILDSVCKESHVTKHHVHCKQRICLKSSSYKAPQSWGPNKWITSCIDYKTLIMDEDWDDLSAYCGHRSAFLKFKGKNCPDYGCRIYVRSPKRCQDLEEAIDCVKGYSSCGKKR